MMPGNPVRDARSTLKVAESGLAHTLLAEAGLKVEMFGIFCMSYIPGLKIRSTLNSFFHTTVD